MRPTEFASATTFRRIDLVVDTGLYHYYDRKFGNYWAAVAELIRP